MPTSGKLHGIVVASATVNAEKNVSRKENFTEVNGLHV